MSEIKDEAKKKIDESWKEAVNKEKKTSDGGLEEAPEASFGLFITSLMMQGLVALGELENPLTKKKETSMPQAKFIIDTIAMLKDKTKNNLASDEADTLESILYELRMRFVNKSTKLRTEK